MAATVIVTGHKELDKRLGLLEPKLQKKLVRSALRKSGKRTLDKFKAIVKAEAFDTGAYMQAASVRAMKRSRTRLGVQIHIDRDKLFAIRLKKTGGTKLTKRKDIIAENKAAFDEQHYYPASIEFGYTTKSGIHIEAKRPQRRALYDNKDATLSEFQKDLLELTREA